MAGLDSLVSERLPPNWDYGVLPDGRVFFIDERSRTTTWIHPMGEPIQDGLDMPDDLPPGWSQAVTPEGIPYYVDHISRQTSFLHPITLEATAIEIMPDQNTSSNTKEPSPQQASKGPQPQAPGPVYRPYHGSTNAIPSGQSPPNPVPQHQKQYGYPENRTQGDQGPRIPGQKPHSQFSGIRGRPHGPYNNSGHDGSRPHNTTDGGRAPNSYLDVKPHAAPNPYSHQGSAPSYNSSLSNPQLPADKSGLHSNQSPSTQSPGNQFPSNQVQGYSGPQRPQTLGVQDGGFGERRSSPNYRPSPGQPTGYDRPSHITQSSPGMSGPTRGNEPPPQMRTNYSPNQGERPLSGNLSAGSPSRSQAQTPTSASTPTSPSSPTGKSPSSTPKTNGSKRPSRYRRGSGKHKVVDRTPSAKRSERSAISMRGWLHKQDSTGLKQWKKRWFVLSDFCLFYYKGPDEQQTLGSILLPSYKINPCLSQDNINKKMAFKAEHANMRTYFFAADGLEDMKKWMNAMSLASILQRDPKKDWERPIFPGMEKEFNRTEGDGMPSPLIAKDGDAGFNASRPTRQAVSPSSPNDSRSSYNTPSDPTHRGRPLSEHYPRPVNDRSRPLSEHYPNHQGIGPAMQRNQPPYGHSPNNTSYDSSTSSKARQQPDTQGRYLDHGRPHQPEPQMPSSYPNHQGYKPQESQPPYQSGPQTRNPQQYAEKVQRNESLKQLQEWRDRTKPGTGKPQPDQPIYENIADDKNRIVSDSSSPPPSRPPLPVAFRDKMAYEIAQQKTPNTSHDILESSQRSLGRLNEPLFFQYPDVSPSKDQKDGSHTRQESFDRQQATRTSPKKFHSPRTRHELKIAYMSSYDYENLPPQDDYETMLPIEELQNGPQQSYQNVYGNHPYFPNGRIVNNSDLEIVVHQNDDKENKGILKKTHHGQNLFVKPIPESLVHKPGRSREVDSFNSNKHNVHFSQNRPWSWTSPRDSKPIGGIMQHTKYMAPQVKTNAHEHSRHERLAPSGGGPGRNVHGMQTVKEDPTMPESQIVTTAPHFKDPNHNRYINGHRMSITAEDLLGKTHEELVLMLIELRRKQSSMENARKTFRGQLEVLRQQDEMYRQQQQSPDKVAQLRQQMYALRKECDDVENQLEVHKPMVNLVDNMVKMGSLYGGQNAMLASQYKKHILKPEQYTPPKKMIEFSRQLQETKLTNTMKEDVKQLTKEEATLEEKQKRLIMLDKELQEISFTVTSLQEDKQMLEKALADVRRQLEVNENGDPRHLDSLYQQYRNIEKELQRVHMQLAHSSQKLEEVAGENAKVEHEVMILRSKVMSPLQRSLSTPALSSEKLRAKMRLEKELDSVQHVMDGLSRQGHQLSAAMNNLRTSTQHLNEAGSPNAISTYNETDLDSMQTNNIAVGDKWSNETKVNGNTSQESPLDINEADDNMKRFYGIIPKEKPKAQTVRDVKQKNERKRQSRKQDPDSPDLVASESLSNDAPVKVINTLPKPKTIHTKDSGKSAAERLLGRRPSSDLVYGPRPFSLNKTSRSMSSISKALQDEPVITQVPVAKRNARGRFMTISSSNPIAHETPKVLKNVTNEIQRSKDDQDAPVSKPAEDVDIVDSNVDEWTIDRELMGPEKVLIPERYQSESEEEITEEEKLQREEKAERIRRMLSAHSLQEFTQLELNGPETKLHEKVTEEKKRREMVLELRHNLAREVTIKSKEVAAKRRLRNQAATSPTSTQPDT